MKRYLTFITALILAFCLTLPTMAYGSRMNDGADLLSSYEEEALEEMLDSIYNEYNVDAVIVTANSTNGKSVTEYADDFYDSNGYGDDGILFLIDMGNRQWWISTAGVCIDYFSDSTLDYIGSEAAYYLGNGDYYSAFEEFISIAEVYIENGVYGYGDYEEDPYYGYNDPYYDDPYGDIELAGDGVGLGARLIISLVVGFIFAFIIASTVKSKLTTVGAQKNAAVYAINNSMQIAATTDNFLFKNVSRVPIPRNNSSGSRSGRSGGGSSHRSSSGRSHGGRGGGF